MRFDSLSISNFKAIRRLEVSGLSDVIVIAGPNGCGKSCIFDAIRLLKSAYGGYRNRNEWHEFLNEFQIDVNNPIELKRLFRNRGDKVIISAIITLTESEVNFIRLNCRDSILRDLIKQKGERVSYDRESYWGGALTQAQIVGLEEEANRLAAPILKAAERTSHAATLTIEPASSENDVPRLTIADNPILQLMFISYSPESIGIIDYHGPNRFYQREKLGSVNVSIEQSSERLAQHALYNYQGKYSNIKSELASAYIRDIFIREAGGDKFQSKSILTTIHELFDKFLIGKKFMGPVPGSKGQLDFPVLLEDGAEHDIDDLSSGEKELVYGYLRLRNTTPRNSILLLDEPELHLNPNLLVGLPQFYREHLGADLNNQLWMVTHSDTFLKEAVRGTGFLVFHMSAAQPAAGTDNQAIPVRLDDDLQRAIFELVGDLARYRPGRRLVIFESDEEPNFDAFMTCRLFPELEEKANIIAGHNKDGVKKLHAALRRAIAMGVLDLDVYAIVDKDDVIGEEETATVLNWNVYHIENYLLDAGIIYEVLRDHQLGGDFRGAAEVEAALRECATSARATIVAHRLRQVAGQKLMRCIDLGGGRGAGLVEEFREAVERTATRIGSLVRGDLSLDHINLDVASQTEMLDKSLADGSWKNILPGRTILREFVGIYVKRMKYELFRNSILGKMRDQGVRPEGMMRVVNQILN